MRFTRVTIIRTSEPSNDNINELLQWFGGTLGLFNIRDKDRSCFRIFIVLLKAVKQKPNGLSSDDIAERTSLSRGTVVYHLNKLMSVGLVSEVNNKYYLMFENLEDVSENLRREVNDAFDSLSFIGRNLDKKLGLDKK
ncbi:winged helix-turn-helix domain-containing protein [Candidatus Woesearchaeota archaeon]|nr:winged helix-turn-helix domain-containing protein [Candidatus Woesearchaeota archaeon]